MAFRILLYGAVPYALPILRPILAAAQNRGIEVAIFYDADSTGLERLSGETWLSGIDEAYAYRSNAVVCAANEVPYFLPGIKVQVFHGFSVGKRSAARGHFRLRGFFDLYCTQGPDTTLPFLAIGNRVRYFQVVETGWSKLDPCFKTSSDLGSLAGESRPIVMFGSTFTESLSAAPHLFSEFKKLVSEGRYYFVFTLHPKIAAEQKENYLSLQGTNARYVEAAELPSIIPHISVLVADSTSLISECVVMLKPVICFRNSEPKPFMIQIDQPDQLRAALQSALKPNNEKSALVLEYANRIHPSRDGHASDRILDAVTAFRFDGLAKKPFNFYRKLKQRIFYRWVR